MDRANFLISHAQILALIFSVRSSFGTPDGLDNAKRAHFVLESGKSALVGGENQGHLAPSFHCQVCIRTFKAIGAESQEDLIPRLLHLKLIVQAGPAFE